MSACMYHVNISIVKLIFSKLLRSSQNQFSAENINDSRTLFFLSKADVSIESPSNNAVIESNTFDVTVSYGSGSSLFSFLRRFSKVELQLDSKVIATKKSGFLGFPFSAGEKTFTVNITDIADGKHTLQANAKQFLGSTRLSEVSTVEFDRTPSLVKIFVNSTFVRGGTNDVNEVVEEKDGVDYNIKSNVTVALDGIVSLSKAKALLKSANCSRDGSVLISFLDKVDPGYVNIMFPVNSTLLIDGSVFGPCYFGNITEDVVSENDFFRDTEDGFLIIENIEIGTNQKEVTIKGTPSPYLFMFEDFFLNILPTNFDVIATNSTETNNTERRLAYQPISRDFPLSYSGFPSNRSSLLKSGFDGTLLAAIGSGLEVKWKGYSQYTVLVHLDYTMTYSGTSLLTIKKGKQGWDDYLARQKMFSVLDFPTPKFLRELDLPKPKLRLFLDVSAYLKYDLNSNEDMTLSTYTSGGFGGRRLVFRMGVEGYYGFFDLQTAQTKTPRVVGIPTLQANIPSGLETNTNVRSGFEIKFIFDLFGNGQISVFESALLAFNIDAVTGDSLLPISLNGYSLGNCLTCHLFQLNCDSVNLPLQWSGNLRLSVPQKERENYCLSLRGTTSCSRNRKLSPLINVLYQNSGNITKAGRIDVLQYCTNPKNSDDICESACCKSGNFCDTDGKCKPIIIVQR